jgi:DNA-binding transcriptional MerR regulator
VNDGYTVGRLAELAGVTVRTLHHYDAIGLVPASGRTAADYRLYTDADVERLRQVLLYRRLGFGLDEIAQIVNDPAVDPVEQLQRQRALLLEQGARIEALLAAIDHQLEARKMGMQLSPEEQLEVFGTDRVGGEWADEAQARWGVTDAYRESARRTAAYTKDDWAKLKTQSDEGLRSFAAALEAGLPADGPEAMALAEYHRAFLIRWFHDTPYAHHRGLAETYIGDERFAATFDVVAPGLAQYVHDAIIANADAHEGAIGR